MGFPFLPFFSHSSQTRLPYDFCSLTGTVRVPRTFRLDVLTPFCPSGIGGGSGGWYRIHGMAWHCSVLIYMRYYDVDFAIFAIFYDYDGDLELGIV